MSAKAFYDLKDMLCREVDEIAKKPEMSAGDLDAVHKLTDTIKNIDKILMLEEDGGYSQAGDWEMEGRGSYNRGSSYANRGRHYVRGHYSRDGGYDRNGGYSRHDAGDYMIGQLEDLMRQADDKQREVIRKALKQLEDM